MLQLNSVNKDIPTLVVPKFAWLRNDIKTNTENLVYTSTCGVNLNLMYIARVFKSYGAQYNRKRFAAVIIRFRKPKVALLIFAQKGKVVCTGAKSADQARFLIYRIINEIKKKGYRNAEANELKIENLVASTRLRCRLDLEAFASEFQNFCIYEPGLFPGVIFRHSDLGHIAVLLFKSGKMVITGCKSMSDVYKAMHLVVPLLDGFYDYEASKQKSMSIFTKPTAYINSIVRESMQKETQKAEDQKKRFINTTKTA